MEGKKTKGVKLSVSPDEMEAKLCERFGDAILQAQVKGNGLEVRLEPSLLVEVCRFLKEDPQFDFHFLRCLSGVDYIAEEELEVVYHLYSFEHRHEIAIKVRTPRDNAQVPSVVSVWKTANWHEREAYDLLGIVFEGHPDLRRILLPAHWQGHPLRKDYVYDIEKFDTEYAERIKRGEID